MQTPSSAPKFGRPGSRRGFTLVEILIVVLIIGVLLGIALPNFIKARENSRTVACISNLRAIDSAKEQYAGEYRIAEGSTVAFSDLVGASRYLKSTPECPSGGTYTVRRIGRRVIDYRGRSLRKMPPSLGSTHLGS